MNFNEYMQNHRIIREVTGQIEDCTRAATLEFNVTNPDIITVMAFSAWQAFRQAAQATLSNPHTPDAAIFDDDKINGSRIFIIMDSGEHFFFYTLCRNLPPTPI